MATYGWGTNEPIIAPEAEGGENIGTVCVKIKSAIADTFTKLNSETWADASTTASGYMSASDKIKLNGIETGAEVNQFAFSNISVGGTTISADTKQDTLTLTAGTGITLTPNATNDSVTIGVTDIPAQLIAFGSDIRSQTPNTIQLIEGPDKINTPQIGYTSGISACWGYRNPNGEDDWSRCFWMYGQWNDHQSLFYGSRPNNANNDIVWKQIAFTDSDITGNAASATASGIATSLVSQSQNNGIISAGTGGDYNGAAFQARERGFVGATQTDIAYAPRISWHWSGRAAGNLILDRYTSFHFTSGDGSDTLYSNVNAADFFSKNRNCWFAPQPTTSAGVGQIASQGVSQTFTLPAGGTWEVWGDVHNNSSTANGSVYQIVAGGTTVNAGDSQTRTNWFAKRIQ